MGVLFNDRVVKIDDPCGAISVHGYCGWLGAVCVGIFADGTYGTGWNGVGTTTYLGKAGLGATICAVGSFGATYGVFWAVNKVNSIRVSPEVELEGLDMPEFGATSYPEDAPLTAAA